MLHRITGRSRATQNVIFSSAHASSNYKLISYLDRPKPPGPRLGSDNPRWPSYQRSILQTSTANHETHRRPLFQSISTSATPPPLHQPDTPSKPRPDASAPHYDLTSFLSHARRTRLSPSSSTYLGTRYEYSTQEHFQSHLSFDLTRVGRRGDSGIDLLGTWSLPAVLQGQNSSSSSSPSPGAHAQPISDNVSGSNRAIRVLVQCKRLTRSAGPKLIRELEGSFRGAPSEWRGRDVLGVLVCTMAATKGVRDAMSRSDRGLVWIMLEEQIEPSQKRTEIEDDDGRSHEEESMDEPSLLVPETTIKQFLYNDAAASRGLEGVSVGAKYDETGEEKGVQLLWRGIPIAFTPKK